MSPSRPTIYEAFRGSRFEINTQQPHNHKKSKNLKEEKEEADEGKGT